MGVTLHACSDSNCHDGNGTNILIENGKVFGTYECCELSNCNYSSKVSSNLLFTLSTCFLLLIFQLF